MKIDDRKFDPIWEDWDSPVLMHVADPVAFFNRSMPITSDGRSSVAIQIGVFTGIHFQRDRNDWLLTTEY